jgi:hypothetical protein
MDEPISHPSIDRGVLPFRLRTGGASGSARWKTYAADCIRLARAAVGNQYRESEGRFNQSSAILSEDGQCSLPSKRL